ncbi:MAG TPA: GNAT family N-acetyltransferase [Streptosporangiaceae bacterium]|nr:GNAT family N-acetyltransferase [Streptosporangiaceae bacterium]
MIRTSRCPSSSSISRTRSRSVTGPVWRISACRERPGGANLTCYGTSWIGAGDAFELEDLFVEPGWMRRGIGRALVLDMIAIARGRGIGRVEVTANPHALAFYEKAGFVVYREVATRFRTAPRMRLDVTA